MEYRVVVTPEAQAAIDLDIAWIRLFASSEVTDRWYLGLIEAIASLSHMPTRCGAIPEQWLFDNEFRQLLYGSRQYKRRVIFLIDGDTVYIVRYQHGSLAPSSRSDELGASLQPED